MNTLLFIDAHLSNNERVNVCYNLIKKIKSVFPEFKILLINKHINSGNLESEVDYYFYYGDSILIGTPPQHLIEEGIYNSPYVYLEVDGGILENWLPLTGVSDHVGGIYNSYILSSRIAKSLGYDYVFKFEYDIDFDINELKVLKSHIIQEPFYLFYGERHEGQWKSDTQYILDAHIGGYSSSFFEGFNFVKSDNDYWKLCEKMNYWGKWIEYVIPGVLEFQKLKNIPKGITYQGSLREMFPESKFDVVSSGGIWPDKWKTMPRLCRISPDNGLTELEDKIIIFYWNSLSEKMEIDVKTNFGYEKKLIINGNEWAYDVVDLNEDLVFESKVSTDNNIYNCYQSINKNESSKLTNRFVIKINN